MIMSFSLSDSLTVGMIVEDTLNKCVLFSAGKTFHKQIGHIEGLGTKTSIFQYYLKQQKLLF